MHLHSGTFELADGAALTNVTLDGGTVNVTGTVTASGAMSAGTLGGAGTFHVNGPFTWSGGTMGGTGTTRVTSTLTHTANTSLNDTRTLAIEGTLEMAGDGRYINSSGTPVVRNTGTIKRTAAGTVELYAALDNDGRVEGVELEGGGSGSTGEFVGVQFHSGTFELSTRRDAERRDVQRRHGQRDRHGHRERRDDDVRRARSAARERSFSAARSRGRAGR